MPVELVARLADVASRVATGFYGLTVFLASVAAGIVVGMLLRRMVRRTLILGQVPKGAVDVVSRLVYYTVVVVAGLVGLGLAGVDVTGFAFAGSLFAAALGFAAQTVASNFFSGLFLFIDKPLEKGDLVRLEELGVTGRVADVTLFSTRIETLDGLELRIPNERVFQSSITNYSHVAAVRIGYRVGISYRSSIADAVEAVRRVLYSHPLVLREPEPAVYVEELGDSAVVLRVLFWVPSSHWIKVGRELLAAIKEELDRSGVEIPYPQRVVWLRFEGASAGEDVAGLEAGGVEAALRGAARDAGGAAAEVGG